MSDQVNYQALDKAKQYFIKAGRETLGFAEKYGFAPDKNLGASANVFALNIQPFIKANAENLYITLLPEGLGTADDARPDDLNNEELKSFWFNIGIKTVACLTNDAASGGMQTVLISLYLPSASPEHVFTEAFMQGFTGGFVAGCKNVGCVWFSGETPQLQGKIVSDKIDIAGALFGLIPAGLQPINGNKLKEGNSIVFIESNGPHENGFTVLRKLAARLDNGYRTKLANGQEFWQAINSPSHLYTALIQHLLLKGVKVTNVENVTGHGWQKLMRSSKPLSYVIEQTLPTPEIFKFVQERSGKSTEEMLKIFNYGVGCAIYVEDNDNAQEVVKIAQELKLKAVVAGKVNKSERREIIVQPHNVKLSSEDFVLAKG